MKKLILNAIAVSTFALLSSFSASAQITWNGTGADWNTAGDWTPNTIPGTGDTVVFGTNANLNVGINAASFAQNIQFNNSAAQFVLGTTGVSSLTLTNGGTTGITFGNFPGTIETIDVPLIIGDNAATDESYNFVNSAVPADVLNFNGSITGAAPGGHTTTLNFNQITSTINGVIGDGPNGGQLAISTGQNHATLTFTAQETYTGNTFLNNNAILTLSGGGKFGNTAITVGAQGTLNLDVAGAVSQNTLTVNGNQALLTENIANAITGSASLTVEGGGVGGGQANITDSQDYTGATNVSGGNNGGTLTISGSGKLTSTSSVTVGNSGTLNLNVGNAINVSPTVNDGGVLNLNAVNAITGSLGITVTNGSGLVNVTQAQNYTGPTHISGTYYNDGTNNPGNPNLQARSPNFIISGSGSLGNTAVTVDQGNGGFPGYLELNAPGAISQNVLTINGAQVTQGVAGAITGTTTVTIDESATGNYSTIGTAFFGDGNTYTGVTTLNGNGRPNGQTGTINVTLNITQLANGGSPSSIGAATSAASNLVFTGGVLQATNLTSAQSTDRLFTIGDVNPNVNADYGLSASATIDSSSANPANTLSFTNTGALAGGLKFGQYAPAPGVVLTGSNTGANTFAPLISNLYDPTNNGAGTTLTKNGTGNWIITNANTFSGNTTLNGGTLELANSHALQFSQVVMNSANGLTFASPGTYAIASLTGSANESLGSGDILQMGVSAFPQYTFGNSTTYSGVLSGAGGVQMAGYTNNNTQFFTTDNTYQGGTTVNGGTLKTTDSSVIGTPFGTGPVTLNGGFLSFAPGGSSPAVVDNIGAVTYSGGGTMVLNKGTNTSLTVNATSFADGGTGTLVLQTNSNDLGTGENVTSVTPPTLLDGVVNQPIVDNAGGTLNFVTYGPTGFTDATALYSNHATSFTTSPTDHYINITAGAAPYNGTQTVVTDAGNHPDGIITQPGMYLAIANNTTLHVGDGTDPAIVILNGSTNPYTGTPGGISGDTNGANGILDFGTSQGDIFADNSVQITTIVAGKNGVVIGGAGNTNSSPNTIGGAITLYNHNNTFSGGLTVNAGATLITTGGSNGNYSTTKFFNGELGDPNNVVTLDGGAILNTNSYFGIGRTINLAPAGGILLGNGMNVASNITGSGGLTVGSTNTIYYGNSPTYDNPANGFIDLTGNNTFTGGLTLFQNYTVVSSNNNLGAATGAVNFDQGYLSIAGNNMHDFGSHQVNFIPGVTPGFDIQDAGNTFTVSQAVNTGASGFIKMGAGTLALTNGGNFTGMTTLLGGTLRLDESNGSSVTSQGLTFAGGTLEVLGATTGSTVQNFTGSIQNLNNNIYLGTNGLQGRTRIGGGELLVNTNIGDGTQSTTVNLGSFQPGIGVVAGTTSTGSTLDIAVTGNGQATVTTTTAPDGTVGAGGTGIYGGRVVYTDASGNTDWATSNSANAPYTLSGYSSYKIFNIDIGNTTLSNDVQTGTKTLGLPATPGNKPTQVNSLKIAGSGTMNLNGNTLTLASGGLLFTGSGDYTISDSAGGGSLKSGLVSNSVNTNGNSINSDDLIIQDYSASTLTISAVIADGAAGVNSSLTKAGPGTLVLAGLNTYSGQTYLNGGILSISSAANLGGSAVGTASGFTSNIGNGYVNFTSPLPAGFTIGSHFLGQTVTAIYNNGADVYLSGGANATTTTSGFVTTGILNINGGTFEATASMFAPTIILGSSGGGLIVTGNNVLTVSDITTIAPFSSTGTGALTINGDGSTGTVVLTADQGGNAFYGGLNLGGGTVRLQGAYASFGPQGSDGDSAVLGSIPANYVTWLPGSSADLQLNGSPALVAGLQSLSADAVVENGSTTPNQYNSNQYPNSLLAVANGDNETYAGRLVDNLTPFTNNGHLAFLKAGGGTLSLTNTNSSYTGTTEIDGGILNVASLGTTEGPTGGTNSSIGSSSNAASNLIFGGGTLQYTGNTAMSTDRLFTLGDTDVGGNTGALDASGASGATVTFSNTGAIVMANTGVHNLTLTGTNTDANTFNPTVGDSTFNGTPYATSLTKTGPGTWVTTSANTYSGGTQALGGTLYVNGGVAGTSSGTGTGTVAIGTGGALGGSGVIRPTIPGAGITMSANSTLISGGIQAVVSPTTTAGPGLTLDNRVAQGVILDASIGTANLTFSLGAGNIVEPFIYDFANPNMNSTFMTVLGTTAGELKFASGDSITVNDLTGVGNLQLNLATPYLLITAGSGLTADNNLYAGLITSGGVLGGVLQNGWVENLSLGGTILSNNGPVGLYLYNGNLEVVPEPSTWALMLGGLATLVLLQRRKRKSV